MMLQGGYLFGVHVLVTCSKTEQMHNCVKPSLGLDVWCWLILLLNAVW